MPRSRNKSARTHECMIIFDPDLGREGVDKAVAKLEGAFSKLGGEVAYWDHWGERRLSYPIKKKRRGYYAVAYLRGSHEARNELARVMRFSEEIVRWVIVKPYEEPDLEALKNKSESKARAKAAAEPGSVPPPPADEAEPAAPAAPAE